LNRWKNFFNQALNIHGIQDVRQMDIYTTEPLVPEVEIAIGKLERYKSADTGQIPPELTKAGGETLCSEIHNLIHSIGNILLEFDIPKKLVRLIKMYLNENYSKVHVGKLLFYTFPI
jgi:hypothetical protein